MPNVRQFLDLSISHLSRQDRYDLDYYSSAGCHVGPSVARHDYGWWMYVPEEPTETLSPTMERIREYARKHGCDYVLFDADAEEDTELPTFDESGDVPVEDRYPQFVGDGGEIVEQAGSKGC